MLKHMAIETFSNIYEHLWESRDIRVDGLFPMESIRTPLLFVTLYLTIVIYGPKLMLHRQPLNLKWFIFTYNMLIVILNLYIFVELTISSYLLGSNLYCQQLSTSTDPQEMRIISALHLYLVSKFIELLDTAFMIVRKKNDQLSFLHVYHHSTMLIFIWILCRWSPGGNNTLAALFNSSVHVVMYSYYGLSALGPKMAKYLWWKRYLTRLQLIQFVAACSIMACRLLFGCDFDNKWLQYFDLLYGLSYLFLFTHFYIKAYVYGRNKKTTKDN